MSSSAQTGPQQGAWVDRVLLSGGEDDPCLRFGRPCDRGTLRAQVAERQRQLADAGLAAGGTVALCLPPSPGYVATLLAAWRLGGQVSLLDHRLAEAEVRRALDRLAPQVLVQGTKAPGGAALRGYADVEPVATALRRGRPAETGHALIQLSSGSTGPSKVIGRTAADLEAELGRYALLPRFPRRGERIVLLASMVHVLGLVGGLLHALHAGVELVLPERLTAAGILDAVSWDQRPTTVIGVPFYAELLSGVAQPPGLPHFARMIVAGELVRPGVPAAFAARYGVPLGTMYGMTELGVIATDLTGELHPAVEPTAGLCLEVRDGELHILMPASPYLGATDPARWSDGWLHTRDAARAQDGGRVVILGRNDSQVSIGGLKVDLTEVEHTLGSLPGVAESVIVFEDGVITAYAALADATSAEAVRRRLGQELASYKQPRHLRVLPALPRTATGKLLRDPAGLRKAAEAAGG
ncbi:long-chain fatty acid--CoA ligase [Actinocrinis puniceicyclus]|uniref:Long-chain fatty acid--CoA ligase n=1 Tax=Actinocrinis puniceicyclus TaxID=977794 RepID=A0A8J7WSD6_9ACTN|nr:long-chain fatty acid--CoA ligase [Actinocrinis puniceicyclus]